MKKLSLFLGCLCITFPLQSADKPTDPLPNIQLPVGQMKQMSAQFIKDLIGKGVDLTTDYLIDFSKASFQLERAKWTEGRSHIYAGTDFQIIRNVFWENATRANYSTYRYKIDTATGKRSKVSYNTMPFGDYEESKRYWRSFLKDGSNYKRIEGWVMNIHYRLRNTYYKGAKFPSKDMKFPASVRIYYRLQRLPAVLVNGKTINFKEAYHSNYLSVKVPSEYGVSRDFELITKQNSKLHCDYVPSLWVPGLDDGGLNNERCQ